MADVEYNIFTAARDGMVLTLYATLCNRTVEETNRILLHETAEDGQKTTPFIIAARNGHFKVVKILLTHFSVDLEQTGTVKFDGFVIQGATALWCAAGAGHLDIVKCLLNHGAEVNHTTLSNSTPLRAACFDGRPDIVRYLVENGADISIPNKYDNTCLMIACYKGHNDVVQYLLEQGADPNSKAHCGATALHFSAERGYLKIVELLVKHGALLLENDQHMNALQIAAEGCQADIVEFFILHTNPSVTTQIEALELLGASYANDKENYDVDRCYAYLMLAMQQRYQDSSNIIKKSVQPPIPAYENRKECETVEELECIKEDHNALHMESLILRERILGEDNIEIPHPVIFRGAVFADSARFDRCIELWRRALRLRQKNGRSVSKDILRFAQVFSQMVHVGAVIAPEAVEQVLDFTLSELQRDKDAVSNLQVCSAMHNEEEMSGPLEILEGNIHTALYLLIIMGKITRTKEDEFRLGHLAYRFNQMNLKLITKADFTPLHMACDENTYVDDFHVNDVVAFPNDALVRLLIQSGANVSIVDSNHNLPLHIIVKYNRPISDFLTLHNIIVSLIDAGCHIDQTNSLGETSMDASTTGVAEIIIRTRRKIQLKCLAACAVKRHGLNYQGQIPVSLEEFVALH